MKHFLTSVAIAAFATFAAVSTADARGRGHSVVVGKAKGHFSAVAPHPPKLARNSGSGGGRTPKPPKAAASPPPPPPKKLTPIFNGAARPSSPTGGGNGKPPSPIHRPKGPFFKPPGI